jgi:hypothetical protein
MMYIFTKKSVDRGKEREKSDAYLLENCIEKNWSIEIVVQDNLER